MGEIAVEKPAEDNVLSGVLLKKNFSYHIFASEDIPSKIIIKIMILFLFTNKWLIRHLTLILAVYNILIST